MTERTPSKGVDEEWVTLLKEAKHLGLSVEEVEYFLTKGYSSEDLHKLKV